MMERITVAFRRSMRETITGLEEAKKRIIVGISAASGATYGVCLLEMRQQEGGDTHLIISKAAGLTIARETGRSLNDVRCWQGIRAWLP